MPDGADISDRLGRTRNWFRRFPERIGQGNLRTPQRVRQNPVGIGQFLLIICRRQLWQSDVRAAMRPDVYPRGRQLTYLVPTEERLTVGHEPAASTVDNDENSGRQFAPSQVWGCDTVEVVKAIIESQDY